MIKQSRYLAFFFILVVTLPGVFAPTVSDVKQSPAISPTAADSPPLDPPIQTTQDFEGDLNQSIIIPGNDSLVPYRVDVNVTSLNHTSNRLLNGDFTDGLNNWQGPNVQGKTFQVNESGPQGARSLQGNFTGLWNTTQTYPLNTTLKRDQFDDPGLWDLTSGVNVTAEIDGMSGFGTTGNYLNISWWKDRAFIGGEPQVGFDVASASRSFVYIGSPQVLNAKIKFDYNAYIYPLSGGGGSPDATIRCNVTISNPQNAVKTFENAIVETSASAPGFFLPISLFSGLESIVGEEGTYILNFSVSIQQYDIKDWPDNIFSRLLIDNVSVEINSSIGTFNLGEGTNVTQIIPLSQVPSNDTKVTINYCASAIPARVYHTNLQLGFAINETWFNLSALSDLTMNEWNVKTIWVDKGLFTGIASSFKLGLMSFNASELLPNETLLVYFTNVTLEISNLVTGAELNLGFQEVTKNAPLAILRDDFGIVNASVDYSGIGSFGLGTTLRIHVNSTLAGGIRGRVTIFSWTWREALWRSLDKSLTALEGYITTLPNIYADLFSNTPVNITHFNFARAMAAGDYYLARTYATRVGPNALYTASIANTSLRLLWPALGNASLGAGVPDRVFAYVNEIYEAQLNPRSLVPFLESDPRWGWIQANATLAGPAIYAILEEAPAKVPLFLNASTLIEWAGAFQVSINSCIAGASWIIPEPAWTGGKTEIYTIGYSNMAKSNLQRPLRPAFPILTTATQFVGGAPLLATLAQSTNSTASWNYLTQEEFHFVAYFDAIIGYLAESTSIARLLESVCTFISEGTRTPASKYYFEQAPTIDIFFSSDHFGSPELAITASWQGNASITSAWMVNGLYALSSSAPVLIWEQALAVDNLVGTYTRELQWLPPTLPPALNELYVDAWDQNWTAPIVLRSALWVGGREVFVNLGIQQEISEKWYNISGFSIFTGENGNPVNVSQINQTQQTGDWCLLTSRGAATHLEFRENGGEHVGYNPWSVFSNTMGSNATYDDTGNRMDLLSLRGAWAGDLYLVPSPVTNSQFSIGQVITKFGGLLPYFAGIANATLFLTPKMGETTYILALPAWEGTRTSTITGFSANAQIISQSDPDFSVMSTSAPSTISRASFASVILSLICPTKPIGHQVEILLTLSGYADGGIPIQREVKLTLEFVDVISPQPPIPDSLLLACLTIIGSVAITFFIVRWHRFLFFRRVIRENPRYYRE